MNTTTIIPSETRPVSQEAQQAQPDAVDAAIARFEEARREWRGERQAENPVEPVDLRIFDPWTPAEWRARYCQFVVRMVRALHGHRATVPTGEMRRLLQYATKIWTETHAGDFPRLAEYHRWQDPARVWVLRAQEGDGSGCYSASRREDV